MIDIKKLREIQDKIAKQVVTKDAVNINDVKLISGFDLSFFEKKYVCAGVVYNLDESRIVEKKFSIGDESMPYIPTLLAFREGPPIIKTYDLLENKSDVIMVEGHGVLHPYNCGLACYVGVSLNKSVIGVAKKLLYGKLEGDRIYIKNKVLGFRIRTKDFAKPIFISPGHNISLDNSIELTKKCLINHKLPEPLYYAHKFAKKIQRERLMKKI